MDTPLPTDPALLHGTLSNQLSYYVLHNPYPKSTVVAHLVVAIGSLVEKEEERGVAHFLEQLAFRGTASYSHGELIKFFESVGMSLGQHVNAHTGQAETIYKLTIPTSTDLKLLEKGLEILLEWANGGIRISAEDVEAERNIIEEEWRGRQGASQRMLESYWSRIFQEGVCVQPLPTTTVTTLCFYSYYSYNNNNNIHNSLEFSFFPGHSNLYAQRWPIGLLKVVRTVTPAVLQAFYKRWYRPDTMAVILVGDFSANGSSSEVSSNCQHIVSMIQEKFSSIPQPDPNQSFEPPVVRFNIHFNSQLNLHS